MSRGRIAHWMLEEVGEPYTIHLLRFDKAEHKKAEYLALNPMGKVPSIVHKGHIVTEPRRSVRTWPTPSPRRARTGAERSGAGYLLPMALLRRGLPRACRHRSHVFTAGGRAPRRHRVRHLRRHHEWAREGDHARPYVLGKAFSAADVYIASQIGWA